MNNPLAEDLDHILKHTEGLWEELRGKRIFITGGTGFFGCWLLESFAWANDKLNLNTEALVLSRSPEAFEKKAAHLYNHPAIQFLKGDIKDFVFPEGQFSHLIHGAVYQQPDDEKSSNMSLVNEMLTGTRRVLNFCVRANIKKMLLVSTGAVYGKAPSQLEKIPEDFSGSFDPTVSASSYHHVRRMMESLNVLYAEENNFEAKIARCFSFIGPYLPLNGRFAVRGLFRGRIKLLNLFIKKQIFIRLCEFLAAYFLLPGNRHRIFRSNPLSLFIIFTSMYYVPRAYSRFYAGCKKKTLKDDGIVMVEGI